MAFTNYYGAGTISVSANGTAVTGAGTLWSTPIMPGDTLEAGGRAVRILSVTDDTHLTLAYGWPGSTLSGSAYIIVYNSPDRNSGTYVAERARELIERQRILANGATFYAAKQVGLNTPPGSPVADDLYVVGTSPTGAWSGYGGYLAIWLGSAWGFTAPEQGWYAQAKNNDTLYVRTASAWSVATGIAASQIGAANGVAGLDSGGKVPVGQLPAGTASGVASLDSSAKVPVAQLPAGTASGVATLDSGGKVPTAQLPALAITETFPVSSQSAMLALTAQPGDVAIRSDISRSFILAASPASTLANWLELLAPGAVTSVNGQSGAIVLVLREVLSADRTYYVRTDGSNSNTGLVNSSGGAFLTLQKALDVAAALDFSGYTVTIQMGDGTYTGAGVVPICLGQKAASNLVIQGNSGTPANVVISTTSADAVTVVANAMARIKDMELRTATSGNELTATGTGSVAEFTNLRFGASAASHIFADGGTVKAVGNYAIVGAAAQHVWARNGGVVNTDFRTVTISGTPAFSIAYAVVQGGYCLAGAMTFSGSATGARYSATLTGVINTVGGGASYFPGSSAGSTATGGQYA